MIVTEDDVSAALAYLAADPHPLALARYDLRKAESELRDVYNDLFLQVTGSNELRRALAEHSVLWRTARDATNSAFLEVEAHRERQTWALSVRDIWREEGFRVRAAESIR
jgi:hypothetical protein